MNRSRGLAAGISVVILWASAFPAIRVAAPELGAVGLSLSRLAVAGAALLVLACWTRPRRPRLRDLPLIAAAGFTGMTAYQLLLNEAERSVPAGTASLVIAAAPLVSLAVAVLFLGERLTVVGVLGSVIALAGVAVVSLARSGVSLSGAIALVVAATVAQGVYHPLIKPLLSRYTSLEVATYTMIAGTVMSLPLLPWGWSSLAAAGTGAWLSAIYLGLLPSALGFVLWGVAVRALPMVASTSLLYLVPGVAVLIAFLWLGELPTPGEAVGGLVILAGVALLTNSDRLSRAATGARRRRSAPHPAPPASPRTGAMPARQATHQATDRHRQTISTRTRGADEAARLAASSLSHRSSPNQLAQPRRNAMQLYVIRGLVAIVWAAVFAAVSDSLTTGVTVAAGTLLVLYPLIDVAASLIDARSQRGSARRLLLAGAAVSAATAAALAIAATASAADVLAVFGVWAVLSGMAQLVVALRRRAQLGNQWLMLLAGIGSVSFGIAYVIGATGTNPMLNMLAIYAAGGGIDFVVQAWLLARRRRHLAAAPA